MSENTWCVYKHIFPNGKVYIGVTGQEPKERWDNGMGYQTNRKMFFDIVQFGWNNINHEILFSNLSEGEAKDKERELIRAFGKDGRSKTYNRQFADYVHPDWYNSTVCEATIERYGADFNKLDDAWLDPYIERVGTYPFNVHLSKEGVVIPFLCCENHTCHQETLVIPYPSEETTFSELYEYLFTTPNPERNVGKRFSFPERFV